MIGIRIGARRATETPGDADVTARLRDCHRRIRGFLAEAEAVAAAEAVPGTGIAPDDGPRRVSAAGVLRYFRVALPLHEADEDASIAPRLVGSEGPVLALIEEHGVIDGLVDELARDWEAASRGEPIADGVRHRATLARVLAIFERHLEREESEIFPRIDALPEDDRRAIVREMDERRR